MRRGLFIIGLIIALALVIGCGTQEPANVVEQSPNDTIEQIDSLPDSVSWEGHIFSRTDQVYKTDEINVKMVGQHDGYVLYEMADIGYNEKFIRNRDGDLVLYKIEGALLKKPNIYLYPEEEETIRVSIQPAGKITQAIPDYKDAWTVRVTPDGKINGTYNFLYYEAEINYPFTLDKGWIVDKPQFNDKVDSILKEIGLNELERDDFLEYWGRELTWEKDRYAIYYISANEIEEAVKLSLSKEPDSILRVYFFFVPVDSGVRIEKPTISPFMRKGFTVVEWGGLGQ